MSICIFPGTFNPIHNAHIKMAEYALDKYNFEKIIFIPSYIPPHKNLEADNANHRYNMVKLAISHNPKFEISDIEFKKEQKSYTIYTVKEIKKLYNIQSKLNLIIGTDAFEKIDDWYKADELKDLVHFIVFKRGLGSVPPQLYNKYSFEIANMDKIDISSTDIRNHINGDINKKVKDYIKKNELYIKN